jgi:adenosylhomocysteine nucleosidase
VGAGGCRVLIMAALPMEVQPFLRQMGARPRRDLGPPAWEIKPGLAVAGLSGMGPGAAGWAGEILVRCCQPGLLVSLGFGGSLAPGLAPGDLVLGGAFWNYDPDTGELRRGAQPAAARLRSELAPILAAAGLRVTAGSLVSTGRIIHKGREGRRLTGLPQPVVDLETGALAAVAAVHGLPFLALRAITDAAGEEIPGFLRAGVEAGAVGAGAALGWLAADPRRLRDLISLWRHSRGAARSLARALTALWPLLLAAGGQLQGQPG